MKNICVFGAARNQLDERYFACARRVGELLAENSLGMVFGAGDEGLMGAAARGVHSRGGRVIGVIPELLNQPGIAYPRCDELIVTPTMHQRKATMESLSDGYIVLPGGLGTLEEMLEVLTLNQLGYLCAPVAVLDLDGFYAPVLRQFETCIAERMLDAEALRFCQRVPGPQAAVDYLLQFAAEAPE